MTGLVVVTLFLGASVLWLLFVLFMVYAWCKDLTSDVKSLQRQVQKKLSRGDEA